MAEVTCSNFFSLLPHIEECINSCEFLAIDTEFTGLTARSEDEYSFFDTMEERYQKLRRFAQMYTICQFGISAFVKVPESNKYVAHTFNCYPFPRQRGEVEFRVAFQVSNVEFLCEHQFDFNKSFSHNCGEESPCCKIKDELFYEGIPYLNRKQEEELLQAKGSELGEKEHQEAVGFARLFQAVVQAGKPLLGHNMLSDLALIYEKFHEPLPDCYLEFKRKLHELFPLIIDTKSVCNALRKYLAQSNLLEFSSLIDLYEALGSQRGTFYVLCTPDICHAEESQKYCSENRFHEAGFDAFCVGFVFLRIAHMVATKGVKSTEVHPVHMQQYLQIMRPYSNRINLIRGPIPFIDLNRADPPSTRSDWMVVTSKTASPLSIAMVQEQLGDVATMEIRFTSPKTAVVIFASKRRVHQRLSEIYCNQYICVRQYSYLRDSPIVQKILWRLRLPGVGIGLLALVLLRRYYQ